MVGTRPSRDSIAKVKELAMLKAGTMILTACLLAAPLLAQDKGEADKSDAVITELKERVAKAEAALKAGLVAEEKARLEAELQRQIAEKALKAAEAERENAIQAREEALKLKELAERERLEALKAAEQEAKARKIAEDARAAEEAAKKAATEALEKERAAKATPKQPKAERGKKRRAHVLALEKQVDVLTQQMQAVQAELKALRELVKAPPTEKLPLKQPGAGFEAKGPTEKLKNDFQKLPVKEVPKKQDSQKQPVKEVPTKDQKLQTDPREAPKKSPQD
jgi:hypothetical protein